ncbi:MAG: CotH kinase family protein [Akkermansiaceae bacterium]|nr:CotH kinase family protein [Akkermansiaceae bacterium]
MKRSCIPFIACTLLAAPAQAALTAYDGFDYTPDEVVVGKNGGSGFSGAWVNEGTNGTGYVVKPDGLTFSDLSVTGGRVQVQANGGWAASSRIGRDLSASASGQTYGSFLYRRENDNSPNTVAGLLVGAPAMADNDHTAQFYPDEWQQNVGVRAGGDPVATATGQPLAKGETFLVLFSANLAAESQALSMWVLSRNQFDTFKNGGLTASELNNASVGSGNTNVWARATASGTFDPLGPTNNLKFMAFGGADGIQVSYDELRLSKTSLADAAPRGIAVPIITSFTATPDVVAEGGSATLNWSVSDADTVTLDGGSFVDSDVTGQEMAIATNLTSTTTFTLTATNALESTSTQVTVRVGTTGAEPFISEFLTINDGGLEDGDGDNEDWIEICNPDSVPALLTGWFLTDDPLDLTKWKFPATTVPGLGYVVVFASGENRIAGAELHTNFKLSGSGEYLALVKPDGTTIATEFEPTYPPQQSNVSYGFHGNPPLVQSLFPPTPGSENTMSAGPIIRNLNENSDPVPGDGDPIIVSAEVSASPSPVTSVTLHYRVMFGSEILLPMTDSGGGIYRATIPASASTPGQMVRWRLTAASLDGKTSRSPLFDDPLNSPEYHGTVIADPAVSSQIPVMHRFLQNPDDTENRTGTRGAFFYNGEFFDNIFSRIRGGTAVYWPKKSYKIEFNDGHHFRLRDGVPRVDEINLNTTYTDKSYVRAVLAYEHQRDAGLPSPEAFHVHLRQNNAFWNVAILVEQPDRDFLRRWNLDPDGALYKATGVRYEPSDSLAPVEKKTRLHEDKSDLDAFIDGIAQTDTALDTFLFDNVDLPTQINYMATTCITQNIDGSDKNHYIYRDTEGSGEWTMLPWDLDLTFGPNALITDTMVFSEAGVSHPWVGVRPHTQNGYPDKYNHFLEAIVANPRSRAMLHRRIRTLIDEYLATDYFNNRIDELVAMIGPDVLLDKAKWGDDTHFGGTTYTLQAANQRIVDEYLVPRVPYLSVTQGQIGSGNGSVLVPENAACTSLVPTAGSLGDMWKFSSFNDSSWLSGTGAIGYERSPSSSTTYTPLLGIDLLSPSISASRRIDTNGDGSNENNSCYVRYKFNVADKNAVSFLNLRVKYDDGFVAFLNGVRVAARNAPSSLTWDADATAWHDDSQAMVFEDIDITAFRSALLNGPNVLAVQAMNYGDTSSDMLFSCELVDTAANGGGVGIPPSQPSLPGIAFGVIESNPASGDQDQEFIELRNTGTASVDLSGWTLSGGITFSFKGGTVVLPGESIYVTPNRYAFRQRTTGPRGAERLLVTGDASGHLSNFGESLTLTNVAGATIASITLPSAPSPAQLYLRITELHHNPPGDGLAEFIELQNTSTTVTLDLTGVHFSEGVDFTFNGSTLAPGERILVVHNTAAFIAAFGAGFRIAGEFENATRLSNGGESVVLDDANNSTIQKVTYDDTAPWPVLADGAGASLQFIVGSTEEPGVSESARWFAFAPNPGSVPDDADGDGHSNHAEWLAGTDAGDAASRFMISSIAKGGDGSIVGSFQGKAGRTYRVFTSSDLTTWTPLGATIAPAASGIQTFTDATPGSGARFYKIATPAP